MKYNVLVKTIVNDQMAMAVYEKETLMEAKSMFYSELASAFANANLTFILCEIINDFGNIELLERYEKPIEEGE